MNRKFKIGDIVVWKGHRPAIGRISKVWSLYYDDISGEVMETSNCYYIDKRHSHLHESNLRFADSVEILILGNNRKVLLPMSNDELSNYVEMQDYIKGLVPKYLRKAYLTMQK